jgi:hypothetical protein
MVGTWQQLNNQPNFSADTMLLITDGTVMCHELNSNRWHRFTPDLTGNYVNGMWSSLQPMRDNSAIPARYGGPTFAPLYFASVVLRDGRVFVAGGEDNSNNEGSESLVVEIFDPVLNSWISIPTPTGWANIGDAPSCVLPDGRVLLGSIYTNNTAIFDPVTNSWTADAKKNNLSSTEETWTLLPDQTVLTVDCYGHPQSEKYIISQNEWINCGNTPVDLVEAASSETGPAVLLPDGRVFAIGATGATALYSMPSNPNEPGNWSNGPTFPTDTLGQKLGAKDAPACLLPNGRVLCVAGPVDGLEKSYLGPTYFFEFDPASLNLIPLSPPPNNKDPPFTGRMLLLPTGQVLFANGSNDIEVYTPDREPNAAWKPTIINYPTTALPGNTYIITGKQLNGLSQACSYGDDAQMATNYPIIQIKNSNSGKIWYCRTFGHSTMGVATGTSVQSTNFQVPSSIEKGSSELTLIANGIPSATVPISVQK